MPWAGPTTAAEPAEGPTTAAEPAEGPTTAAEPAEGPTTAADPAEGPTTAAEPAEGPSTATDGAAGATTAAAGASATPWPKPRTPSPQPKDRRSRSGEAEAIATTAAMRICRKNEQEIYIDRSLIDRANYSPNTSWLFLSMSPVRLHWCPTLRSAALIYLLNNTIILVNLQPLLKISNMVRCGSYSKWH